MNKKVGLMMIGLQRGTVQLRSYSDTWKTLFEKEEKALWLSIGRFVIDIQHVGSTSIPGMVAKPIIDIAVAITSLDLVGDCVEPLEKIGYEYIENAGVLDRFFLVKGAEKRRTHHLHIEEHNSEHWKNHILFREYLKRNKDLANDYSQLKRKLAREYKQDRDRYTEEKVAFIQTVMEKALDKMNRNLRIKP